MTKKGAVPEKLYRDRYWKPVLFLFSEHPKLKQHFTTKYFDLESEMIDISALKNAARHWATSEKFMLNLALHLFNERNKLNLSEIDCLDSQNKELALKAISLRFR
ncbi:hypothetical protein [Aneurinibacillus terranovensis]|uniref:hypothetical protein n=1 Tax=Aneurinibacillus terranovensis TaxID=278991 RepID=UPI00040C04F7|nr:hypothetical protein [Aneurinibacillus terranovensis]